MPETVIYYCGVPKPDQETEWWVLLRDELIPILADLCVKTGKPLDEIVTLALSEYQKVLDSNPHLWRGE